MSNIYEAKNVLEFVKEDIYFENCALSMTMNIINKFDLVIDHLYEENMIAINESFDYDQDKDTETFVQVCVRKFQNQLFIVKMVRDFTTRELISAYAFSNIRACINTI